MSIFYYRGEDGAFHPIPALVGPPGKDGAIAQIEDEGGTKYSLPILKFLNCEVTADTEKVTVSPRGGQGGSGGHIIQDSENSNLPQREILKFAEGFQVSDDSTDGKTIISYAGTKNVAGNIGEIVFFADQENKENFIRADGTSINPDLWPELAAFAVTAQWEVDEETGWRKTPSLQGTIYGDNLNFKLYAWVRAKVDVLGIDEINESTKSGFADGQVLAQQSGKIIGQPGALKTYTNLSQLNLTAAVTAKELFDALPDGSLFVAHEDSITDKPISYFTLVITRWNDWHGMAMAYAIEDASLVFSMGIASSSGGLSGNWRRQTGNDYQAGDSFTITNGVFNGFITAANTLMRFCIPLYKPVAASSVTVSGVGKIRQNGNYLLGTGTGAYPSIDSMVSAAEIQEGCLFVELAGEFTGGENNGTASFATNSLTITFS